ncbi:AMP-dependent synthetase/ligase [Granulicoccus sp. GXG6511]|uniref:AMP-dependent synthetase/ligase n=1 Tax=Granulicoccus sp. GXG6511 TaxID=3381351 RepID=UPI003D7C6049
MGDYTGAIDERTRELLAEKSRNMGEMLVKRAVADPHRIAFRYPDAREDWQELTWLGTKEFAFDLAAAMLAVGLQPEDRVAIAATTRIEWILADLAIMCAGGATTTIYPTTQSEDVNYILADSDSRIAIVEDAEQLAKLQEHPEIVENLLAIVLMDGDDPGERVHSWADFRQLGKAHRETHPDLVDNVIADIGPERLSTLIYTSGTTGRPKGVRLDHEAWTYQGRAVEMMQLATADDVQYLWLPLSHVFGKCLLSIQLQIGFTTAVDGRIDKIVDGLGAIKPTFMAGAPRIFEKVRARVMVGNSVGLKSKIARWAFSVGKRSIPYRIEGRPLPGALGLQYRIADKLVFSKLKARLGGNLRFMVSGSAKLSRQVQEWFYAAGILVVEGYGMTETSAVICVNHPDLPRLGTVGPPLAGSKFKIAEDGELLVRGPGVTRGYHKLPDLTAETIIDGWLHTGDIGELDDDGYLRITDRKKDLMKTSGGKYVAPQKVEGTLVASCPYIAQAIATGDSRKHISALLVLDPDALKGWGENHDGGKLKGLDYKELTQHPEVETMLQRYVDNANGRLERWETVKRFKVLDHELSVDDGAVTPSLKIRRARVEDSYADLIDSMYEKEEED